MQKLYLLEDGDEHTEIAYFFVPVPEALALPDKYTLQFFEDESFDELLEKIRHPERTDGRSLRSEEGGAKLVCSLRFWHSKAEMNSSTLADQLMGIAHKAFPELPAPEGVKTDRLLTDLTIVEVAVPLSILGEKGLSAAFDKGLRRIRMFQRAYHVVTRTYLTLVTRQRLPFVIPVGVRTLSEGVDEWPRGLSLMIVNMNIPATRHSPPLSEEGIEQVRLALDMQPGHRVFAAYIDLLRDARSALVLDGNYRSAVVFTAAAAEVLFNDLLMMVMWEEGIRPEEAAPVFDSGLITRIKTQYQSRLGGAGWSFDRNSVLLAWSEHVAGVRHRVVHAGYEPTFAEAEIAGEALAALETFIVEKLLTAKNLAKYPRTAMALLGREGLIRRNAWNKRHQQLADSTHEPLWTPTFNRWKSALNRCRSEAPPGTKEPRIEDAVVVAVIHPDGTLVWVLHDREAGMARRASPPNDLTEPQAAELEQLRLDFVARKPHVYGDNTAKAFSALFVDVEGRPLDNSDWVLEYRLIPLAGVSVTGSDLDPA